MNFILKNWKIFYFSIVIIFTFLGILEIFNKVSIFKTESYKNKIQNEFSIKLKNCLDLENKNNRRFNESLVLIEYCLKEFGIH